MQKGPAQRGRGIDRLAAVIEEHEAPAVRLGAIREVEHVAEPPPYPGQAGDHEEVGAALVEVAEGGAEALAFVRRHRARHALVLDSGDDVEAERPAVGFAPGPTGRPSPWPSVA